MSTLDRGISRDIYSRSRQDVTRLVSLITGHGPFDYHQSLLCPETNATCRYCQIENRETFFHIFTACPHFNNYRFSKFNVYQIAEPPVNGHWRGVQTG